MNVNEAKIILGITQAGISIEELKRIFKKQILQWHPDIAVNRGISDQEANTRSQKKILPMKFYPRTWFLWKRVQLLIVIKLIIVIKQKGIKTISNTLIIA